jgi:hypothetical protein
LLCCILALVGVDMQRFFLFSWQKIKSHLWTIS